MKSKEQYAHEALLREHGYRITSGRLSLISFLSRAKKPLTATEIYKQMGGGMDKVTLYRALEDFVSSKIVGKINLHDTAAFYEFLHEDHHHHHIVCETCGRIEDIEHCEQTNLQKEVLKTSRHFSTITSHSLEFFGICKPCSKK